MTDRCIQCGWTIAPDRLEEVWRDGRPVALHKGGCPVPDPITGKYPADVHESQR